MVVEFSNRIKVVPDFYNVVIGGSNVEIADLLVVALHDFQIIGGHFHRVSFRLGSRAILDRCG
jgi:hypothetical protein